MPIKKKKISELPLASSLVGLFTIGVDAANKSVKVSLEWLKTAYDNVTDAIAEALSAASSANTAASNANTAGTAASNAAMAANTAATNANTATDAANQAAGSATDAATGANTAKDAANTAAESADSAAEAANTAAEAANQAAGSATDAATGANAAKDSANSAADRANTAAGESEELNAHQPIIQNGTWWVWDLDTDEYIDTTLPARGPEGKGPIVLPNGNYGNWDEASQTYVDSGVPAAASVDLENIPVTFTQAETRDTINSGETVPTVFGKLKKWFADFGELAWKNLSDVGDMRKSIYDTDNDGVVDNASNSDKLEGKTIQNIVDEQVTPAIATHNTSDTAHADIRTKISDVEAIARGKSRARVFNTVDDLDAWLSVPANVAMLQVGDNFYIKATDVPDYWWDGAEKQPLETEKVVLPSPIPKSTVLSVAEWVTSESPVMGAYQYTITDADITDGADVDISVADAASTEIAASASLYPGITGSIGQFIAYCKTVPTGIINLNYRISWL